ncbi:MAG: hypothetical protein ABSG98_12820 [Anaerolineales bacterium]
MRSVYRITFPILMVATLVACAITGPATAKSSAVSTAPPQAPTATPTALSPQATSPAPASASGGQSASGGLGFKIQAIKFVLTTNQAWTFSDSLSGQPAFSGQPLISTATLSPTMVARMKISATYGNGVSVAFYGAPSNVDVVLITMPYNGTMTSTMAGGEIASVAVDFVLVAAKAPSDQINSFRTWFAQMLISKATAPQTTTIGNITYTFTISTDTMTLEMAPAQ